MDQESFRRDRILIHLEYLTIDFNLLDNKKNYPYWSQWCLKRFLASREVQANTKKNNSEKKNT